MADAAPAGKWGDLAPRVASAVVLLVIAGLALWAGGMIWAALILIVAMLMAWELGPLCERDVNAGPRIAAALLFLVPLGVLSVARLAPSVQFGPVVGWIAVLVPLIGGALLLKSGRAIWVGYGVLILLGASFLLDARLISDGPWLVLALAIIVMLSDTLGYFAGRILGGPKFWPRVSPKKTWSGTAAGWVGAALFGAFALSGPEVSVWLAALAAALIAFAGQMGDIAESAMKRRVGIKDSSNLIPGHGGFLDRLDAMIAAAALAGLWIALSPGGVL